MTSLPNLPMSPWMQKLKWIADPVGYMQKAAQFCPDLFVAKVASFDQGFLFVQDPQAIQYVLTNDRQLFSAEGEINKFLEPLLGEYSLIMLSKEQHKKRRQLLMPTFHGSRMITYSELITKLTHQAMNSLPTGRNFTARKAMQEISLQVILEAVFGLYEGERAQKLKHLMAKMGDTFSSSLTSAFLLLPFLQKDLGPLSPWGYYLRQRNKLDQLLYEEIGDRRANPNEERTDILSLLMSATDEEGNHLTDKELRDELLTLLFAGHETTATAMSWALYWIHKQPKVKSKLLAELASLGENPDCLAIAKLPYLTAVCNETLRIHPVAMLTFPRIVQEPVELLGHKLAAKTVITGCIYLMHHREDLYPNSQEFRPERFLEKQFSPYEFMPFGGGVRRCLGEALAIFEMKLVIATIMSNYELNLATNEPEKPARRGITLAPKNGVKMILTSKNVTLKTTKKPLAV
jgi:cytochrome P450 family 110